MARGSASGSTSATTGRPRPAPEHGERRAHCGRERHASHGRHAVLLYDDERELARAVAEHLAPALRAGEPALVLATGEHRELIGRALGEDAAACRMLDAQELLRELMVDGHPDAGRFAATVGARMREAAAGGMPAVYGELVAVLWRAGMAGAAIELEALWEVLADELRLDLLCAYPAELVGASEDQAPIRRLCGLHTRVIGPPNAAAAVLATGAQRDFPRERTAPRAARRFVVAILEALGAGELADPATIVLSELATNAVAHAESPFEVPVEPVAGAIRIAVADRGGPGGRPLACSGHGLGIVAALASAWGVRRAEHGLAVWAELPR